MRLPTGANPFTNGWICAKVKHTPQLLHGPDRITTPLRRIGPKGSGEFVEITWDEALDLFADRIGEAVDDARLAVGRSVSVQLVGRQPRSPWIVAAGVGALRCRPHRHHHLRGDGDEAWDRTYGAMAVGRPRRSSSTAS